MNKKPTSSLLPYVINLLSRKRTLCNSVETLCDEIKDAVIEDLIRDFDSLKQAVEFAIDVGLKLGVLTKSGNGFRLPFRISVKRENPRENRITAAQGRAAIRRRMKAKPKIKVARAGRKVAIKFPKVIIPRLRQRCLPPKRSAASKK